MSDVPSEERTAALLAGDEARPASLRPGPPAGSGDTVACCHLGLERDPFAHYDEPSSEHRCYLWMQRDRIDLSHQEMFCLTAQSKDCPWLTISTPPKRQPLPRRATEGLAQRVSERLENVEGYWQHTILQALLDAAILIARGAAAGWRYSRPILLRLGLSLMLGLRWLGPLLVWPLVWLSRHYRSIERAALRGLAALGRALWRSAPWARAATPAPIGAGRAGPLGAALGASGVGAAGIPAGAVPEQMAAIAQLHLRQGMEAMRDGDSPGALHHFRLATAANDEDEQTWLWRGALADSTEEKADCFRHVLAINPQSARARAALAQLGVASGGLAHPAPAPVALLVPVDGAAPSAAKGIDLAIPWRCPDCGTINPRRADTCQRCRRPSPRVERDVAAGGGYMDSGLAAMRAGNEDLAYHYFGLAAETARDNEQAWYWRAKTAPTVAEVIRCLRQIVALNPANAKAQADLAWALQREQREQLAQTQRQPAPRPQQPSVTNRVLDRLRAGLLPVASICAFLLALLFILPSVVSLTDLPTAPAYRPYLSLLPGFKLPALPVQTEFAPAFDLGAALPLILALLLFHAAFTLGDDGGRGARIWLAFLGAAAVLSSLLWVANGTAARLGATLALATVVTALAGRPAAEAGPRPAGGLRKSSGVAMVELAIILPALMLILLGILDLGRLFYSYEALANGAREGARYCSLHPGGNAINRVIAELDGRVELNSTSVPCPDPGEGQPTLVSIQGTFRPLTPLISDIITNDGTLELTATATMMVWR